MQVMAGSNIAEYCMWQLPSIAVFSTLKIEGDGWFSLLLK
jgi:hypothetical protein